ncbi:MAG: tail fiber domain-containing protein [Bacteroidetes bacterium]|nr:tail fiber domain-containing protein [Bacteroidota bacterium]
MGSVAGQNMTDGEKNVIIGYSAANGSGSNLLADGDFNVFIGADVQNNTLQAATRNVVIGTNAAVVNDNSSTTAADRNVVVGHNSIAQDILGTVNPDEINYSGVFGANTTVGCDSCIVVGNNAIHRVGIGLTMPGRNTMLDVNPRGGQTFSAVFRSLDIQSNGITVPSDANLKDNLQPLTSVSNALSQLNTYSYNYKHNDFPQIGLDDKPHFGFLAQEVEAIFPQLVTNFTTDPFFDSLGVQTHAAVQTKGIRYLELIPLLLQGFKEQKNNLDSLKQQVQDMTQQLNNCCGNPQPMPTNGDNTLHRANVSLSNNEIIVLNQNSPNPFKDKTEITYILPESVKDAVILFYDHSGKVLQKFDISHRGAGPLTVYGEDLTSSVYTYSLIIDGENHQTKRMVKQ